YDKNECQREESPHRTSKKSAAQRIALKLRATRSPAQGCGTKSVPRQGHNTPLPLERPPPVSFKRLLGRNRFVRLSNGAATVAEGKPCPVVDPQPGTVKQARPVRRPIRTAWRSARDS